MNPFSMLTQPAVLAKSAVLHEQVSEAINKRLGIETYKYRVQERSVFDKYDAWVTIHRFNNVRKAKAWMLDNMKMFKCYRVVNGIDETVC